MLEKIIEFLTVRPGYVKEGGERLSRILMSRGIYANPDECREGIRVFNQIAKSDEFYETERQLPNILLIDIETAPMNVYVWKMWKQDVHDHQIERDWFCLTWSAKWLFDDKIYSNRLTPEEALDCNDERIMVDLWPLLDKANIVIAHNANGFDIPRVNMRFLYHGLTPTSGYQVIDTLTVLRKNFGFSSNKLDYVAKTLGIPAKIDDGGFENWIAAMKGEESALIKMEKYNRNDVVILEDVYMKIRPWIKSHPNVNLYNDYVGEACPNCGSSSVKETNKYYYTQVGRYEIVRCSTCGALGRRRVSTVDKDKRKSLLVSIAN